MYSTILVWSKEQVSRKHRQKKKLKLELELNSTTKGRPACSRDGKSSYCWMIGTFT